MINKENWLRLATSEIPENRMLALELAAGIAEEIQLELYLWHEQVHNPFHKVQFYELLSEEYSSLLHYSFS